MKKAIISAVMLIGFCTIVSAQSPVRLYDGKAPGSENWTQKEATIEYMSPFWNEINTVVLNVVDPVVIPYLPAPGTGNGAAVLVCPGGGFSALSWNNEGPQVAEWLSAYGFTAFVLKYRTAYAGKNEKEVNMVAQYTYGGKRPDDAYKALAAKNKEVNDKLGNIRDFAYQDAIAAMKYIRRNAGKYDIASDKIAIVGFSAGAALALEVLYNHDEMSKPNMVGSIYGAMAKAQMPQDPCPLFIAATQYEIMGLSYELYGLWCKNRLPSELHSFTDSRHGFGYRPNGASENIWAQLFYNFMVKTGFIQ